MKTCPICQNENIAVTSKITREDKKLDLIFCNKCDYRGLDLEYKELYKDGSFSEIARGGKSEPDSKKIFSLDRIAYKRFYFYKKYFNSANRILEAGSSAGSLIDVLKLAGINAEGIEPDKSYADFSKKQYGFTQYSDLLENFETDNLYDLVCSFHVIEHVDNPIIFIENNYRLLKRGGRILVECPSWEIHSFGNLKHTIWEPHRHYFSRISLHFLLSRYFKDIKTGFYNGALFATGIKRDSPVEPYLPNLSVRIKSKMLFVFFRITGIIKFKNHKFQLARNLFLIGITHKKKLREYASKFFKFIQHSIKEKIYLKQELNIKGKKPHLMHFTLYKGYGNNAGDLVLSKAVRDTINTTENYSWDIRNLHSKINENTISEINQSAGVIVGGGGLFLPDTNLNTISHWQWPVSKINLEAINKPLIGYAIGYNYFPGQKPIPEFVDNLDAFINKCDFIGLRNHGSIEAVNKLLNNKYKDKIAFQPCPTTIISKLQKTNRKIPEKNIAINIAFDRYEKRFGSDKNRILLEIGDALLKLHKESNKIYYVAHLSFDNRFLLVLDRLNIPYTKLNLHQMIAPEIINFYSNMDLVIGMRGHAQMIPFGVNTMILTLGTHNKMRWFLEDIDALDWYIDVRNTESLDEVIADKAIALFNSRHTVEDKLQTEQAKLYEITKSNLNTIRDIIGL
jgi:SAM-dependent methyltransferase/polysaccharide pyruvyl transferase WcaK-like protein